MKKNIALKIVSIYEVFGGLWGIVMVVYYLIRANISFNDLSNTSIINLIILAVVGMLYLLSLFAGFFLWNKRKVGFVLSTIIQIIQVPYFLIGGFAYMFYSGVQIAIAFYNTYRNSYIALSGFNCCFNLMSDFMIRAVDLGKSTMVGINIIPIIIIIILTIAYKKCRESF